MARTSINRRILTCDSWETDLSGDSPINLSDTVFEFLSEECESSPPGSSADEDDDEEENQNENGNGISEDDNYFWKTQHQLLQATICRTSSLESQIRNITKDALRELKQSGNIICSCGGAFENGCWKCLMEEVCRRLQDAGFNCAICKSKWKSSHDIPSGTHTFLDVIDNSNPTKGDVRVIIELNFRCEFDIARANEEYNNLIKKLPEIFVGRIERLLGLLKILCAAGKKCMKEKRIHMAPWRKYRYMQAKWMRNCERVKSAPIEFLGGYSSQVARPRVVSMLSVEFMDSFASWNRSAVKVV